MEQNRNGLNSILPAYEKISEFEIMNEEFEKTPKRSIKRYLYK
jgi:long-chain acyl-CoA synthetase